MHSFGLMRVVWEDDGWHTSFVMQRDEVEEPMTTYWLWTWSTLDAANSSIQWTEGHWKLRCIVKGMHYKFINPPIVWLLVDDTILKVCHSRLRLQQFDRSFHAKTIIVSFWNPFMRAGRRMSIPRMSFSRKSLLWNNFSEWHLLENLFHKTPLFIKSTEDTTPLDISPDAISSNASSS